MILSAAQLIVITSEAGLPWIFSDLIGSAKRTARKFASKALAFPIQRSRKRSVLLTIMAAQLYDIVLFYEYRGEQSSDSEIIETRAFSDVVKKNAFYARELYFCLDNAT